MCQDMGARALYSSLYYIYKQNVNVSVNITHTHTHITSIPASIDTDRSRSVRARGTLARSISGRDESHLRQKVSSVWHTRGITAILHRSLSFCARGYSSPPSLPAFSMINGSRLQQYSNNILYIHINSKEQKKNCSKTVTLSLYCRAAAL